MTPALEKRIRRHVIGKPQAFFAVTPPGFEDLCLEELRALGLSGQAVTGGVEFTGRLHDAYRANLHLRTANRILMRLTSFRATRFEALAAEAAGFPWELFLDPDAPVGIRVATHHCRLHHTEAVAERIRGGIEGRLAGCRAPADPTPARAQQVFVRGLDDRFTLSLDSSGESLYRRGIKKHPGRAPLRETLAAAALMRAGFTGSEAVIDPMCGTGTFALEAAMTAKRIPPGWFREFAFEGWPGFSGPRWEHFRRAAGEGIRQCDRPRVFAADIDQVACRRLEACVGGNGLADAAAVRCADFFSLDPGQLARPPGIVALNPPYGRRIGAAGQAHSFLRRVLERLATHYRGWGLALVAPEALWPPEVPFPHQARPFVHGGLRVVLVVGEVPP
jgi:putative N6-adenine-specific DNA methylase